MYPVLFHIFGFPISPYGVLLALALLIGVALAVWRARQVSVPDEVILDTAFFATLSGFAGGRITYILTHWDAFLKQPLALILDRSGFTFLGGLILAIIVSLWVIRRRGQRFFNVADIMAPSVAFGHILGRLGCFCAGCCYGSPTPHGFEWLGVVYHLHEAGEGLTPDMTQIPPALDSFPATATTSLPVWPTQLFEAAGNLAIFVFLLWLWRRRKFDGHIFCAYLLAYAALRFGVEFMRGDADRGIFLGVSTSQWLSVGFAALGGCVWAVLKRHELPSTAETQTAKVAAAPAKGGRKTPATAAPTATAKHSTDDAKAAGDRPVAQSAASTKAPDAGAPADAHPAASHVRKRKKSARRHAAPEGAVSAAPEGKSKGQMDMLADAPTVVSGDASADAASNSSSDANRKRPRKKTERTGP